MWGPTCDTVPNGESGYAGTRPKLGFIPTLPQNAAGIRTDPAPSVPTDKGPIPAATAAAVPPDDPPGVLLGSQGFRVIPVSGELVSPLATELGGRGLADQYRAGFPKPRGGRRVDVPGLIGIHGPAAPTSGPPAREEQILDRNRDTVENATGSPLQPSGLAGGGRLERIVGCHETERVQHRIEGLDPGENRAGRLDR